MSAERASRRCRGRGRAARAVAAGAPAGATRWRPPRIDCIQMAAFCALYSLSKFCVSESKSNWCSRSRILAGFDEKEFNVLTRKSIDEEKQRKRTRIEEKAEIVGARVKYSNLQRNATQRNDFCTLYSTCHVQYGYITHRRLCCVCVCFGHACHVITSQYTVVSHYCILHWCTVLEAQYMYSTYSTV